MTRAQHLGKYMKKGGGGKSDVFESAKCLCLVHILRGQKDEMKKRGMGRKEEKKT